MSRAVVHPVQDRTLFLTTLSGAAIIGVLVTVTNLALVQSPWLALALLLGIPLAAAAGVILIWRPHWAIWCALALLFFGNRTEFTALYFWGRYLPTIGIGAFVAAVLVRGWLAGNWRLVGKSFLLGYAIFTLVLLVSAVYNQSSLRDIALSLITNLRYPLFFVALLNAGLAPSFYRRVITVFIALTMLQIPVSVIQFIMGLKGDWLSGTMGSNQALVSVVLSGQIALLVYWLRTPKPVFILAILALLIPTLLGDVQIGLLFFPLLTIFVLVRYYGLQRLQRVVIASAIPLVSSVIIVLGLALSLPQVQDFLSVFSEYYLRPEYYTDPIYVKFGSIGRVTILPFSLPLLFEDPPRLLWGFGPEAAQGGLRTATFTDTFTAEISDMGIVCQKLAEMDLLCREPQTFKSLMEFGFLGTLLYMIPLGQLWLGNGRLLRQRFSENARFTWLLFQGVGFFYIVLGIWYIGVWRFDGYSFLFWLLAAAVIAEKHALAMPQSKHSLKA